MTHALIEVTLAGIIVLNVVTPEETLVASREYLSCMPCSLSGCHLLATIASLSRVKLDYFLQLGHSFA